MKIMEENKELQELKDDDLEQVIGGKTLPVQANVPWGQLVAPAPTSFDLAVGLGKSYVVDDASIAINPNLSEAK